MPLKWERGKNPYIYNYFGKLQVGPNMRPTQIVAQARSLVQMIIAGEDIRCAANFPLDEHAINEASSKLRDPRALAEELLLVHPQPEREKTGKVKKLVDQIKQKATMPKCDTPIPLLHPLAVFWLIPTPGQEAVDLPDWDELGFVGPGDPEDLLLDIVFDS